MTYSEMVSVVSVRKHRAPNGALRHRNDDRACVEVALVRKHRAPKGALRQVEDRLRVLPPFTSESAKRHKAH